MDTAGTKIEAICKKFEEAIQENLQPRIEEFITKIHESHQKQLFIQLFGIELDYYRRIGVNIDLDDWLERFPQYEVTISNATLSQVKTVSMPLSTDRNSIENAVTKLTRYRVTNKLGEGGMGTVYKAYDTRLERDVAIKFPHIPDVADGDEIIDRFFREAKAASGLDHPNICTVYDRGEVEGLHYIVMKYIDGKTLDAWAKSKQPLHATQIANIFVQLTDALQVVHENNQIHRDVKPGNILVSDSDRPVLTDFGLVREGLFRQAVSLVGTPAYGSPEQFDPHSSELGPQVDIYSLGATLYSVLTGQAPFSGSANYVIFQAKQSDPIPPSEIIPTCDRELARICLKMMSRNPNDRYHSMPEVRRDLERVTVRQDSKLIPAILGLSVLCIGLVFFVKAMLAPSNGSIPKDREKDVAQETGLSLNNNTQKPLIGDIDIKLWNSTDTARRNLSLTDADVLPLQPDDSIRVYANSDPPSYLYLIWISPDGSVIPVYPGTPGDWNSFATQSIITGTLSLPDEVDQGWPMDEETGMETLVLLARRDPVSDETVQQLQALKSTLPPQTAQDERAVVWFNRDQAIQSNKQNLITNSTVRTPLLNEQLVKVQKDLESVARSPQFHNKKTLEDSFLKVQKILMEKFEDDFEIISAISFVNNRE